MKANFYSICLENIEVRSERIIMAAGESVFALFHRVNSIVQYEDWQFGYFI